MRHPRLRAAAVAAMVAAAAPAAGQTADQRAGALEAAFQAMLRDLADPSLSFRYAQLATEAGEIAGAIAALERLLLLNPALDNIRLELALFYYRLGNNALAKSYAERALASPLLPPDVRPRAERLIADIDRGLSRHLFTGELAAGARYDSNVNGGPSSQTVRGGGLDIPVVAGQPDGDWGLFASALGQYAYDLGTQKRDRIDVNAYAYSLRYLDRGDFDLDILALDAGVWLYPFAGALERVGIRPHVGYTHVFLERQTYLRLYGGGLTVQAPIGDTLIAEATGQGRIQDYQDSDRRPATEDQNGVETAVTASLAWQPAAHSLLVLQGQYVFDDAARDYVANHDRGVTLTWRFSYAAPGGLTAEPWSTAVTGRYRDIVYDAPDPLVDPAVTRRDWRREFSVSTTVPLWRALAANVSYQRTDNDSNLENYAYSNNAVWMNLTWRL
ncbi:MAG: surface lipoprotein assembly modifier [Rhodospirillales bacterium]